MKISSKHRKEHLKRVNFAICELHFNKQKLLYQAPIPDSCRWRMSCLTLDSSTAPQMPAEHHRTFCPGHLRSHFWNLSRNYFQSPKELLLMNATKNACAQGQTSFEDRNHRVNAVPLSQVEPSEGHSCTSLVFCPQRQSPQPTVIMGSINCS